MSNGYSEIERGVFMGESGNAIPPCDSEASANVGFGFKFTWLEGWGTANAALHTIDIQGQHVLSVVPRPGGPTSVTIIDNMPARAS